MKKILKKYGTMIAAAVFLTAAGLYYGFGRNGASEEVLLETEAVISEMETATLMEESAAQPEESAAVCYVHICGKVKNPGVYELPEGSRIFEAVEAAGGFVDDAAEEALNLAEKVTDGMQIVVMSREEAAAAASEAALEAQNSVLVNINTASKEQLMTLKGIGESRADDIIRYREESGGFQVIEDIMKVPGIKESGFQKIKDSITV